MSPYIIYILMNLVYCGESEVPPPRPCHGIHSFKSNVYLTVEVINDSLAIPLPHFGVDRLGDDLELLEVLDLILDEGDERGDHHGHLVLRHHGRQLVNKRFPASYTKQENEV